MPTLRLGLPKGSLESATIGLFDQAGWKIRPRSRNYYPDVNDPELECALVRAQEMAPYVANGTLDLGLTGLDWILETQAEVEEIRTLTYSKSSDQPSRWVLVVAQESPIESVRDLSGKRIATVEFSWGATEAKVVEGIVDAAVEITETGSTIRAHGLRIVEDLLYTETRLIANPQAFADPWKRAKIEQIATMLEAALTARQKVALKLNVSAENLDEVVSLLPSLHAPTVSHLYDRQWLAVETVVDTGAVRNLVPKLRAAGAEGILEYELRKMI
jgi:ATP phosphoribosyltransferase